MFVTPAYAQAAGAAGAQGSFLTSMLPLVAIFVIFYFLLIRPQQKRAKEHRNMVEALGVGEEVMTSGGILGKITKVDDQWLRVEVAKGIVLTVARSTVSQTVPKGSYKAD